MNAFVFVIVIWFTSGKIDSVTAVFSSMENCRSYGADIAEQANKSPKADHVRWRCEEVDDVPNLPPPANAEPDDTPKLPPGHPPIGERGA